MEKLLSIIEAQRELLNFIGYDIDIKNPPKTSLV